MKRILIIFVVFLCFSFGAIQSYGDVADFSISLNLL